MLGSVYWETNLIIESEVRRSVLEHGVSIRGKCWDMVSTENWNQTMSV